MAAARAVTAGGDAREVPAGNERKPRAAVARAARVTTSWLMGGDEEQRPIRASTPPPAANRAYAATRVAALLARYADERPGVNERASSPVHWNDTQHAVRKVVPLTGKRTPASDSRRGETASIATLDRDACEVEPASGAERPREARLLVGWNESATSSATGRRVRAMPEHAGLRASIDVEGGEKTPSPTAAAASQPPRHDAVVRLRELLGESVQTASRADSEPAPPAALSQSAASLEVPIAERASLGRVVDTLARIEERLAGRGPQAEATFQWFDDGDDGLAQRIQGILRRQVERHGIDAP
jgi:hypothetical protein